MVPMFDNLNHSNAAINNEIVNLQYHKAGNEKNYSYLLNKHFADYTSLYKVRGYSD